MASTRQDPGLDGVGGVDNGVGAREELVLVQDDDDNGRLDGLCSGTRIGRKLVEQGPVGMSAVRDNSILLRYLRKKRVQGKITLTALYIKADHNFPR